MISKRGVSVTLARLHVSDEIYKLIVSLEKFLATMAIRTISKHGYRFEFPVSGDLGQAADLRKIYRARTDHAAISESMLLARDLLDLLAENPNFAPAWAWLAAVGWFSIIYAQ